MHAADEGRASNKGVSIAGVVTGTLLAFLVQAIVRRCKKS